MLQPLRGKILIKVLNDAIRTQSGLYLAGVKEEVPHRGLVVSMGLPYKDKRQREYAWGFQVGHIVHFKRIWQGIKDSHIILRRDQIYAIEHAEKAYGIAEYIIVKKSQESPSGRIFVPNHFETEVAKQISYGEVISVGREDKLGVSVGDKIIMFLNEGLSVRIPLMQELWSVKPRAILGIIK